MKTIEFHIAFKYVLISLGVVHVSVGVGAMVQGVRESITIAELTDLKWQNREEFTIYNKSNSILKSSIMPFIVGASCLVLAFLRSFYLLFLLIALALIELFLFCFSALTIYGIGVSRFEKAAKLRRDEYSDPNDEVYDIVGELEMILTVNKAILGVGIIAALLTDACVSWIWKLSRPQGLSSSGTTSFTLQ